MSESRFEAIYERTPPWETGRPQPAIVEVAGRLAGRILDVGCGTGENALALAGRGLEVTGVDIAKRAVARARQKAEARGLAARFLVHDVLELGALGETFDGAIDSGVFHIFPDQDRPRYVDGIVAVLSPGARLVLVCFSELEPDWGGPRRVRREELEQAFGGPRFQIEAIERTRFETVRESGPAHAWRALVVRR